VILIADVNLAGFGGIEFDPFTFLTDQLVLDLLEVSPVSEKAPAIATSDTKPKMIGVAGYDLHAVQVVDIVGAAMLGDFSALLLSGWFNPLKGFHHGPLSR